MLIEVPTLSHLCNLPHMALKLRTPPAPLILDPDLLLPRNCLSLFLELAPEEPLARDL